MLMLLYQAIGGGINQRSFLALSIGSVYRPPEMEKSCLPF